jgi:streptogramin lyase
MGRRLAPALAFALVLVCVLAVGAVAAPSLNEFQLPTKDRSPAGIARGPEGNVWFAESGNPGAIGRITPGGSITEFTTGLTTNSKPTGMAAGPDGNLWFTEAANPGRIAKITPEGAITEFTAGLTANSEPLGITAGPDGNLWFTEQKNPGRIGRITPEGAISEFSSGLTANSQPTGITAGPDGNLWFTESANPGRIGRITPEGAITEFSSGLTANSQPTGITAGPDGNLWFTERANPARIGRITITGTITEFAVPTPGNQPTGIGAGNDGNVYFTEQKDPGHIGRITPAGAITEIETPTSNTEPEQIVTGANGNLWFTEAGAHGQIGTLTVAPGAAPGAASSTEQTAILKGLVTPNSQATTYRFEWGPTASYGTLTASGSAGSGASQVPVSTSISGLSAHSTYHFRVVATNASGTSYGPDTTFTTTEAPSATSTPATGVSTSGAVLHAQVNPHGQATTYHFEWGTTPAYGQQIPLTEEAVGSDESVHAVEAALEGLTSDTSYHYRVVATNCGGCAEGTTAGADQTFTTAVPPAVTTGAAGSISGTAASLAGIVNPHGAETTYYFEWGETTAYGNQTPHLSAGDEATAHQVSAQLSGLEAGRTYHFRLVASNCEGCVSGTSFGEDATFSTPVPAVPAPVNLLSPAPGPGPSSIAAAPPQLGRSAAVRLLAGTVTVRLANGVTVPLTSTANLPVGAVIDVRNGTLQLTTAVDRAGHTQSATLWGGSFSFSQTTGHGGMTTFKLAAHAACRSHTGSLAAVAARKKRSPTLWAKDNHGHFSSRGQNSVATVRGTMWGTSERCNGTLTTVRQGSVRVRPLHGGHAVTVRAGHSYLARR